MAHPKRQHSKQRTRKRRAHWKVKLASLSTCSNCSKPVIPHRVCPFCGFYKGKQVIDIALEEETPEAKS